MSNTSVRKRYSVLASILILYIVSSQYISAGSTQPQTALREVPLTVKVVLIGFDKQWVDANYFSWRFQTPDHRLNNVWNWWDYQQTGVEYEINYDLTFAPASLKDELVGYLKSIGEKRTGENRWFYYWDYSDKDQMFVKEWLKTNYVAYDAAKVEQWLNLHSSDYGGYPENGWTFVLMYLPELPKFTADQYKGYWTSVYSGSPKVPTGVLPHYYSAEAVDTDLGYKLRWRDFMNGYGGHQRMWFVDLTAGPTWWSEYDDLPLNTIIEDQKIVLGSSFGRQWLTQFLADHTWEMVYNIAAPEFVYDPIYTSTYRFVIRILDDRDVAEKKEIPIQKTINNDAIRHAFEDLVPYATVQVDTKFDDTSNHPELQRLLKDNRRFLDSYIVKDVSRDKYEYVDERPVYKYLQENLYSFVAQILHDENQLTIPIFVFLLSKDAHFGSSYKWEVSKDRERTYGGVAQGDLVMIGQSHLDFHYGDETGQKGKGIGLTQIVIHEAGHMVGLSHPHSYGWIGDFCSTAMSYFTYDYVFGQNDKDALQRIHADKVMMETSSSIQDTRTVLQTKIESPETKALVAKGESLLREASAEYSKMNYAGALKEALEARESSKAALAKAKDLPEPTIPLEQKTSHLESELATNGQLPLYLTAGLGAGLVIAVVIFLVMRRQVGRAKESAKTPLYIQPLRRCGSCGNEIMPQSVYCEHCGAKQA